MPVNICLIYAPIQFALTEGNRRRRERNRNSVSSNSKAPFISVKFNSLLPLCSNPILVISSYLSISVWFSNLCSAGENLDAELESYFFLPLFLLYGLVIPGSSFLRNQRSGVFGNWGFFKWVSLRMMEGWRVGCFWYVPIGLVYSIRENGTSFLRITILRASNQCQFQRMRFMIFPLSICLDFGWYDGNSCWLLLNWLIWAAFFQLLLLFLLIYLNR